jgi:Recombination, repair and ssDNA binding protein UvsY
MNLDQLKAEWAKDCHIDNDQLTEASLRTANLHQKYLDILTDYKLKIFKLDKEYLTMKGLRSRYYNGQLTKEELKALEWDQYQYKTPLKSELERLLESDENLMSVLDRKSYYEFCFEYCEEVLKSLRERNWQIRNAIEFIKFQAGV